MVKRSKGPGSPLTPREKVFAAGFAAHGDAALAAQTAGYAHPGVQGAKVAKRPEVAEAVRVIQARRLHNNVLPLAVDRLERILQDDAHKAADHISAAKVVLSYTLGKDAPGQDKAPEDMTADELAQRMAALRARQLELSEGAQVIEGTASKPPENDVFG